MDVVWWRENSVIDLKMRMRDIFDIIELIWGGVTIGRAELVLEWKPKKSRSEHFYVVELP